MSLQALTQAGSVAAAMETCTRYLDTGGESLERTIGYAGGTEPATVRWYDDLKFWTLFQPDRLENRYWCAFGVGDPNELESLSITCEINPPREGIDRRCAGLFVRSGNGTIYLAHSGKISGGRTGIGKQSFLEFYGDENQDSVAWPDGKVNHYLVIAALDDEEFRALVAEFVHKVDCYKRGGKV